MLNPELAGPRPPTLRDPIYNQRVRVRGHNGPVSILSARDATTAVKVCRRVAPDWGQDDHLALAQHHVARARKLGRIWALVADRAAMELFGRKFAFGDYLICAIGRDELSERHKRVLRHCAYNQTRHMHLALAHHRAAGKKLLPP